MLERWVSTLNVPERSEMQAAAQGGFESEALSVPTEIHPVVPER